MLRSFVILSLRNLFRKNRLFTLINIGGLSIGLASVLLVALFIYDEYIFDRYHKNANRIYRIVLDFKEEGNIVSWARTSAPIAQHLRGAYPEVEEVVRLRKNSGTDLLTNNELKFFEERLFFADSTLFRVFDIDLVSGNSNHALHDKNSIVLTAAMARKYFGNEDPVGKTLRLNNKADLKVTGIIKEMPANSHFVADAFVSFSTLDDFLGEKRLTHWGWMDHYTYVLLTNGSQPQELESKFPDFLKKNAPEWATEKETLFLQPLTSIHFHSDRKDEVTPNNSETYSYILGTIALFILLMACANFINLSTATLVSRFKEISIQKVLGATRIHLSVYFWIEAIVICITALSVCYAVVYITLPFFNRTTGKQMSLLNSTWILAPSLVLTILIGLLAGIIPTLQSAKLDVLRHAKTTNSLSSKSGMRTLLISFQFSISILLITSTLVISSQFRFLQLSRFGFTSENVIVIPVKDRSLNERHKTLVNEIAQTPGVMHASYSSSMPAYNNAYTYTYTFTGSDAGEQAMAAFLVDRNFFDLYDIKLQAGRFPDPESQDTLADIVINQAAVDQFQLKDPIGQTVSGQVKGRVVGVIENFNYESLHSSIKPMIMYAYPSNFRFVSVKFADSEVQTNISGVEKRWQEIYPGYPMEYYFLNDKIEQLYSNESKLNKAYTSFSVIAIIIASIGLIGLTTYVLTRKLKELSIRKVFGSTTSQLVTLVYKGYIKIIILASLVAWLIGYYWMNKWLDGFAFKTELSIFHFVAPVFVMLLFLLLTTLVQTVKASRTNPIDNLRDE
jgi:putative ABC transport system permease protein